MKKILNVLKGRSVNPPPFWMMRQAGRYLPEFKELRSQHSFWDVCYIPELAVEVVLQPLRRFPLDGAILFSDILIIPHGLGQTVTMTGGPHMEPLPFDTPLKSLSREKLAETLDAIEKVTRAVKEALPSETTFYGFSGGPWTLLCYMLEGSGAKKEFARAIEFCLSFPREAQNLIEFLTNCVIDLLKAQERGGIEVIQIFESWAGLIPYPLREAFIYRPTRRIVEAFPHIPVVGFPKGLGLLTPEYIKETAVSAINLDGLTDLEVAKTWGLPLQGNLDPRILLQGGEVLVSEVRRIKKSLQDVPHIFNLSHGILPQVPTDHVHLLIETLHESCHSL